MHVMCIVYGWSGKGVEIDNNGGVYLFCLSMHPLEKHPLDRFVNRIQLLRIVSFKKKKGMHLRVIPIRFGHKLKSTFFYD